MKRAPVLLSLSREHHHALTLAHRLIRNEGEMGPAAAADFPRHFNQNLEPHFQAEENTLLPALSEAGEHTLVERTALEHRQLRALSLAIAANPAHHAESALAFARLLKAHVRFEERTLFPRIEAVLSAPRMAALHLQLHPQTRTPQ